MTRHYHVTNIFSSVQLNLFCSMGKILCTSKL